jgi:PPOX class probable F420-dependent enzyme
MLDDSERSYLASAPLGRLATADGDGNPHVVPVCFALAGETVVTPLDEKPQSVAPADLRRVRDIRANPRVALVVDHWASDWDALGWVQLRGTAEVVGPGDAGHADAVAALRDKYDQYAGHALEERPAIRIEVGSVRSWGRLDRPGE